MSRSIIRMHHEYSSMRMWLTDEHYQREYRHYLILFGFNYTESIGMKWNGMSTTTTTTSTTTTTTTTMAITTTISTFRPIQRANGLIYVNISITRFKRCCRQPPHTCIYYIYI